MRRPVAGSQSGVSGGFGRRSRHPPPPPLRELSERVTLIEETLKEHTAAMAKQTALLESISKALKLSA